MLEIESEEGETTDDIRPESASPINDSKSFTAGGIFSHINQNICIIDLTIEEYGIFVAYFDPIEFIPDRFIPKIRKLFASFWDKALAREASLLDWKKVLLVVMILTSSLPLGGGMNAEINRSLYRTVTVPRALG